MITTQTYREHIDVSSDLLAAYSALDHGTTADLTREDIDVACRLLLARTSALLSLHGAEVPEAFLEALGSAKRETDPINLMASFLEAGDSSNFKVSELQQELVHFSRIVDIGTLGFDEGIANQAMRRLCGSSTIPNALKVVSELIIVTRSRILQRGLSVDLPWLRPHPAANCELDDVASVWIPDELDYILIVTSPRRRTRKNLGYRFNSLLAYLTPAEAVQALWAYACGEKLHTWLEVTLVSASSEARGSVVCWNHPGGDISRCSENALSWCRSHLPAIRQLSTGYSAVSANSHGIEIAAHPTGEYVTVSVSTARSNACSVTLKSKPQPGAASAVKMRARARDLLRSYEGPDIRSIECGHIHLDRSLDVDQEVGVILGSEALRTVSQRQTSPPALTPMMDDDHVLVRLRPALYRAFLEDSFPGERMHLIAESSPIVRSIVCALWVRLNNLGLAHRCRERGRNLFFELDRHHYCELFEEFSGDATTGCVFFELGLLIYRSAPVWFDDYFRSRFAQECGVHESAFEILDSAQGHDDKAARLRAFYAAFVAVTNPHRPDAALTRLVEEVIESASPGIAHLNVLEDYYETQQDKVRLLIELLRLPIRLLTIHFNAQTGRVVLNG